MVEIIMPMPGKLVAVKVEIGQKVEEDEDLVIIEAMKMEMPVVATRDGTIREVICKVGEAYQLGDVLILLE
jgi:acetyl-CoA carboxylase biotin carboxyl carrier protein